MDTKDLKGLMEAYSEVYAPQEVDEATAMAKRGYDEAPIRQNIAKSTGGGEAADRASALEKKSTFGDTKKEKQRQNLARAQRGDFRKTTSSSPGLQVGQHKSDDPTVKAKQAARGAQRGALTPAEKKQLNREGIEIGEAVKGADPEMRKAAAAERKAGIKPLPAKEGEKYAKYKMAQMAYAKRKREMDEELDIFDVVLEFLQAEGYAETLEQAEWMMANVIDEEAIAIVIGEAQHARENPEKYEAGEKKKYAPVRGERTPMPPRGDKRREDFEKWYRANVR